MFMNEYNTIEYSGDWMSKQVQSTTRKNFKVMLAYPRNANLKAGIGLQSHFATGQPNLAYMRSGLDFLGATGFPIWLTELGVGINANLPQYLEQVLREGISHPAVQGIIMFAGPVIGEVVDKLLKEWKSETQEITTDDQGFIDVSLFHGEYEVTAKHNVTNAFAIIRIVPICSICMLLGNTYAMTRGGDAKSKIFLLRAKTQQTVSHYNH
ncbi:hypothetical protein ACLB2K_012246 [Fragaria x ananassa]